MKPMPLTITYLKKIGKQILVVFYDLTEKWQFRVIDNNREVSGQFLNFSSFESALTEAVEWLECPTANIFPLEQHQELAVAKLLLAESKLAVSNWFDANIQVSRKYQVEAELARSL
ncbi:hypothetical protein [Xenococcus sp. PCC 7305]|uniref:hypothetical protein n=1 Tax=Xenococcus sp. PCC 7305 TaxID=102125 RepID=UPI0003075E62|nr:hypothetical protein [Xenococcus sp. PCC 7305]